MSSDNKIVYLKSDDPSLYKIIFDVIKEIIPETYASLMVVYSSIAFLASTTLYGLFSLDSLKILTSISLVIGVMLLPPNSPLTVKRTVQEAILVTLFAIAIVTTAVLAFVKDTQSSPDKRAQEYVGLVMFVGVAVTVSEELPLIVKVTVF